MFVHHKHMQKCIVKHSTEKRGGNSPVQSSLDYLQCLQVGCVHSVLRNSYEEQWPVVPLRNL